MELDLNKEMEVLLRRAREGGSSLPAGPHLDADTISAFASNAIPAAARPSYVTHLADCTRCRTILAELIKHPEEMSEAPSKVFAVAAAPWYSSLFSIPKSAYATASLVIIFGAIAIFFITQNLKQNGTEISRNVEPAVTSPKEVSAPTPIESASPSAAETPSSVESATASPAPPSKKEIERPEVKTKDVPEAPSVTAGAPPPPPAPVAARVANDNADEEAKAEATQPAARKSAPVATPQTSSTPIAAKTTVNGKTFVKKDGVWIDEQYSGQNTTSVKRGSDEFKGLDAGLRNIANKISGTVIVVWNGRAYRIQ